MSTEKSYGFIIVHRENMVSRYLLVRQLTHWSFPKGHSENNESPLETAHRELFEECGIKFVSLVPDKSFTEEYEFDREGVNTKKINTFFVAEVENETIHPQPVEILECRFADYEEARSLLTYNSQKHLLDEAEKFLRDEIWKGSK